MSYVDPVDPGQGERVAPSVVHVVISLAHGGLERLVVEWTNARNRRRPRSTSVCCLDGPGDLAREVEGGAVHCLRARRGRFPWDRDAVRRLKEMKHGGCAAMLHSHNLGAQQYAALAARGAGLAHVHTQHGVNVHNLRLRDRWRSRWLARMTDRIVAVSESTAKAMTENQHIRADRISVIPNGIASLPRMSEVERTALRAELGIAANAFVMGSVGRLAHVKGHDRLLRAFAQMGRVSGQSGNSATADPTRDTPVLLLVGDGPEREGLQALARGLGVGDRVVFAGFRADARRLVAAMDLFVLPSRSEGLPVALLEAMAAGCPVAATDAGDNAAVLDGGRAGEILPGDEGAWPGVFERLLGVSGAGRLRELVEYGRDRAARCYSLDATLDAYERLYRELGSGRQ